MEIKRLKEFISIPVGILKFHKDEVEFENLFNITKTYTYQKLGILLKY